jgi:predicted dehydrogenase
VHVAAFQAHPASEVVLVCDADAERAAGVARRFGVEQTGATVAHALERRDVDIVALATPDTEHAVQALAVLDAGKHVLVEIPMATEIDECRRLVEAVRRSGKHLQMAQQVRWAPYVMAAKSLVDAGELGELFYAEGEYFHNVEGYLRGSRGEPTWRAENPYAGILGGGPHPYDTIRWLTGVEFTEVHAYANKPSERALPRVADDFQVALFKAAGRSGCVAKIAVASGLARPYCLYLSIYGTEGTWERNRQQPPGAETSDDFVFLRKIPNVRQMMSLPSYRSRYVDMAAESALPPASVTMQRTFGTQGHGAHDAMPAADLIDAILGNRPPLIDVFEAARTCAGLRCALESTRTGQPVQIPQF